MSEIRTPAPSPWVPTVQYKVLIQRKFTKGLSLPLSLSPVVVFLLEVALNPGNGDCGPETGPEEGEDPTNLR